MLLRGDNCLREKFHRNGLGWKKRCSKKTQGWGQGDDWPKSGSSCCRENLALCRTSHFCPFGDNSNNAAVQKGPLPALDRLRQGDPDGSSRKLCQWPGERWRESRSGCLKHVAAIGRTSVCPVPRSSSPRPVLSGTWWVLPHVHTGLLVSAVCLGGSAGPEKPKMCSLHPV